MVHLETVSAYACVPAHLLILYPEGEGTRLCVGEHHLQPLMELGALEQSLKILQGH